MLGCRTMRMICSSRFYAESAISGRKTQLSLERTHLEALVLEDPLDGRVFPAGRQLGLEDNPKRAIPDDLALCVGQVFVFSGLAVLDLLSNDFCGAVSEGRVQGAEGSSPPILSDEKADGRFWVIVWGRLGWGSAERADC